MRNFLILLILAAVTLLPACSVEEKPITRLVLVDATGSISQSEYERCLQYLEGLIGRMGRGDRLLLVPITGEPEELLGPRIVRIEMPRERVPYDSNLKRAREEAARSVGRFVASLPEMRATRTDIFGALRACAGGLGGADAEVIALSDMIQDDATLRFGTAPELARSQDAVALAGRLARRDSLRGVTVKVGLLKSSDVERMPPARREAVRAFWESYFRESGASRVTITVDLASLGEVAAR